MVSNIGETSLNLSWTNGFDGLSPITGVTVEVFDGIVRVREIPLTGDSSLQSAQIPGLNEFTLFNITVTVNNAVGSSESAMISAMTLSLSKCVCFVSQPLLQTLLIITYIVGSFFHVA